MSEAEIEIFETQKKIRDEALRVAEKAAYECFRVQDVGAERIRQHDIFENIRNAKRV